MKAWKVALVAVGMFLLGMLIAGAAFVIYLRWAKRDRPLVTGDQLQLSRVTGPTQGSGTWEE